MKIEVKQKHIDKAIKNSESRKYNVWDICKSCVLAEALIDAGFDKVEVGFSEADAELDGKTVWIDIPDGNDITKVGADRWHTIKPRFLEIEVKAS